MAERPVRLYYLGGLAPDEKGHPITVGTRVFRLPPIGGYIEVSPFYASEMIQKYKVITQDKIYDAFTLDPRIAEMALAVKEGRATLQPEKAATAMSNDELLALLKERGVEVAPVAASDSYPLEAGEEDLIGAEVLAAPTKTTRKPKTPQE
jgi:hypothetical protein